MREAILLIGATGTGKTPLGERFEKEGLDGRGCAHFDFGSCLRATASGDLKSSQLSDDDIATVNRVLSEGALLEDSEFHIARGILAGFLERDGVGDDDLVVMNGLPRHEGQARGLEDIIDIKKIIYLWCESEVVYERIRLNSGGDRTDRIDDSVDAIKNKLKIFEERTRPLIDYYRSKGVEIEKRKVKISDD